MRESALNWIRAASAAVCFALLMAFAQTSARKPEPEPAPMTWSVPREYYASEEAWLEAKRMIGERESAERRNLRSAD